MSWITTHSGVRFDFLNPSVEMVNIEDIAHALARLCRFNGHCSGFYSVAEHCSHIAYTLSSRDAPLDDVRLGLMHDASEAYAGDVASPLKALLPDYTSIEKRIQGVIAKRFALNMSSWPTVDAVDKAIFYTEAEQMLSHPPPRPEHCPVIDVDIEGWLPEEAEARFLLAYSRWF